MANTEFAYVRSFETWDALPPSNWIVVRIDGRGFGKFSKRQNFQKPNDRRALDLMNSSALEVVKLFPDIVLAYGQSDEYSFVFHEGTGLFERRAQKIATSVAAAFTAEYCIQWGNHFDAAASAALERPFPTFDGRCVAYPKRKILRDYLSWRQADCHINNLYNTTFWTLVLKGEEGMTAAEAEVQLKGTLAADKNEILFSRFGINYNDEPEIYRKGTVIYRDYRGEGGDGDGDKGGGGGQATASKPQSKTQMEKEKRRKQKARITVEHGDIIGNAFWDDKPFILAPARGDSTDE